MYSLKCGMASICANFQANRSRSEDFMVNSSSAAHVAQSEETSRKYGQNCIYLNQSNIGFSPPVFTKVTIAQRIFALLGCYAVQFGCY